MKSIVKISSIIAVVSFLLPVAHAQMSVKSQARFAPQSWSSINKQDSVTIQDSSNLNVTRAVQITSYAYLAGTSKLAGIDIKGCNTISHINPGQTVICYFDRTNKLISWSADVDNNPYGAAGTFEIQS